MPGLQLREIDVDLFLQRWTGDSDLPRSMDLPRYALRADPSDTPHANRSLANAALPAHGANGMHRRRRRCDACPGHGNHGACRRWRRGALLLLVRQLHDEGGALHREPIQLGDRLLGLLHRGVEDETVSLLRLHDALDHRPVLAEVLREGLVGGALRQRAYEDLDTRHRAEQKGRANTTDRLRPGDCLGPRWLRAHACADMDNCVGLPPLAQHPVANKVHCEIDDAVANNYSSLCAHVHTPATEAMSTLAHAPMYACPHHTQSLSH